MDRWSFDQLRAFILLGMEQEMDRLEIMARTIAPPKSKGEPTLRDKRRRGVHDVAKKERRKRQPEPVAAQEMVKDVDATLAGLAALGFMAEVG